MTARAFEDGDQEDEDTPVDLLSQSSGVVDVRPGIEPNQFILVPRRPGATTIDAFVDEEAAEPLPVEVLPQTVP